MEQILKDGGFYRSEELKLALNTAQNMEQKSPIERAKLRGDRLLKSEKFRDAVSEYRKIIARAAGKNEDDKVICRLWHNMGTAYARQMLFEQAAKCYEKAYEIGQKPESREAYLLALACRDGQDIPEGTDSTAKLRRELKEKAVFCCNALFILLSLVFVPALLRGGTLPGLLDFFSLFCAPFGA